MVENEKKKEKTCKHPTCKKETWKEDKHCIFHSQDIEGKKKEFKEAFLQEFERQKQKGKRYNFSGFVFPDDISFRGTEFEKRVNFRGARFFGKTTFEYAQFSGWVSFKSAQFSKGSSFVYVIFSGGANFYGTQFSGEADFRYARFSGANLSGLFEALRNRGLQRIWKGRYKIKDFRFYMSENIARGYPVFNRMVKDAWYLDDYKKNHPVIFKLWNVMAKCGQSIFRWALWSLFFAFYFAVNFSLIYYVNPWAFHFEPAIKATNFTSFLYYSIVTFTTLGFGDIIPTANYVQRWVMAEVIMGYVMLGGLISILANKLARRS